MSELLFSYADIDVYERDSRCFQPDQWLNDTCISLSLQFIQESFSDAKQIVDQVAIFQPSIVSFLLLQVEDDEEYEELAHGLSLDSKSYLILSINDNQSFESSSSHWSTLFVDLKTNEVFHFDSYNNYNLPSAKRVLKKLSKLLNRYVECMFLYC
jgi:Ulp1 family protease